MLFVTDREPWLAFVGAKPSSAAVFHVLGRDLHTGEVKIEPGSIALTPFLQIMGMKSSL